MAKASTLDIAMRLRAHQESDETFGTFFKALHTFADRTVEEFFSDTPDLPHPVVSLEEDRLSRKGHYRPKDGYALIHNINLNPLAHVNGEEAAETLGHELVHLWQYHIGRPMQRNYHNAEFHERMRLYGIETDGKAGRHVQYIDVTWPNWLVENEDLRLVEFLLPGPPAERRSLLKHTCPECEATFRSRREINALCLDCHVEFEIETDDEEEDE